MNNIKIPYPSNQKIDTYNYGIINAELGAQMPDSVREGCHKVVALLDALIGYYGRYEIFIKSSRLDARQVLLKNNGAKFEAFPVQIQNKMIRSFDQQVKRIHEDLTNMRKFLQTQQDLMADMSEEKFAELMELQEELGV